MNEFACYIEEYNNESGALCARLRDKASNKRIVILGNDQVKDHFLRFLSAAKLHKDIMPTIFCRDGTDKVIVRGMIVSENSNSIEINVNMPGAGYMFQ